MFLRVDARRVSRVRVAVWIAVFAVEEKQELVTVGSRARHNFSFDSCCLTENGLNLRLVSVAATAGRAAVRLLLVVAQRKQRLLFRG